MTGSLTNYTTKTVQQKIGGQMINITNLTPEFSANEKRELKQKIEEKLYDVFSKYIPPEH